MDAKVVVRDATVDDLDQVHAMLLRLKAFLSNDSKPPTLEIFKQDSGLLEGSKYKFFHLFVAEDTSTKKLIGYLLHYYIYKTQSGKILYAQDIFAEEFARKSGVGSLLLRKAAKRALEIGAIEMQLHVREWNPARKFYEAHGGQFNGEIEDKYLLRYDFPMEAIEKLAASCP